MTLPGKNYVFCLDLVLYWPIKRFDKERKKFIVIYEYKETESINPVQSYSEVLSFVGYSVYLRYL